MFGLNMSRQAHSSVDGATADVFVLEVQGLPVQNL